METKETNFSVLAQEIHQWAILKGFYDEDFHPAVKLMLIVSELSEALDAQRDGDREHEAEEIADVMIRLLDYAAWRGINLDDEVDAKMKINQDRPHKHGRQF